MGTSCTVLEPKELVGDVIKEHKKVLNKKVIIESENFEEAMKIINKLYKDEEIILNHNDFVGYTINYIVEKIR